VRLRLWVSAPWGVPLLTLNTARGRIHWQEWRKLTAAWRSAAALAAAWELEGLEGLELPLVERVLVSARPVQTRAPLADAGAHTPTVKAIIDGLGDAGWLAADDPEHVAGLMLWAPVKREFAGVLVYLSDLPTT
jgi:hypothetical protein